MSAHVPLLLASGSPRRRELLRSLGVPFTLAPAPIDEGIVPGESAREHVTRLAEAKGRAAAAAVAIGALVLAADTTVTLDGAILGKPAGDEEARGMLRRLSGRTHEVLTACHLIRTDTTRSSASLAVSRVTFAPWDEARARWYVATGEPFDKAGGYALQGLGVLLTTGVEGSWSNVVGLPLEILPELFAAVGDDFVGRIGSAVEPPSPR